MIFLNSIAKFLYKFKRAGNRLFTHDCSDCGKAVMGRSLCEKCSGKLIPFRNESDDMAFAYYYEGAARQVMLRFKFRDEYEYCFDDIFDWLCEGFGYFEEKHFDAVVPVPSFGKRHSRFYYVVRQFAIMKDLSFCPKLLRKIRKTEKQHHLPAEQRRTNLIDAFEADKNVKGLSILLVDDIYTTGSTAAECRKALFEKGAKEVFILVVLKTEGGL